MTTRNGIAFNATVIEGGHCVGIIENEGNGGETAFFPRSRDSRIAMAEFIGACRLDGKHLRSEEVLELLLDEHSMAQAIAEDPRMGVLRGIDDYGFNGVLVPLTVPLQWLKLRADPASPFLVRLAHALDKEYADTAAWQFWNGEQWQQLDLQDTPS
ncbi:hypothetical protein [Streptomyces chartreusis]